MYQILEELLKERGITAYRLAQETGVTTATLTGWKQGKYTPKQDKLQKIADYFGVTVNYLLGVPEGNEISEQGHPVPEWATPKDKRDLKKWLESPEALFFGGIELTEEDRAKMLGVAEAIFWDAKKRNKEDYKKSREKK